MSDDPSADLDCPCGPDLFRICEDNDDHDPKHDCWKCKQSWVRIPREAVDLFESPIIVVHQEGCIHVAERA